ncbi:xanthine dehydrogenase family protein molybdopterin-binding subunit [Dyella sp.]|uniref:xanthine dehydrogenase family protein molybdopterin-binding subunit n=1 Tax=Dyella sp. TaxID=1869338 RepID=UPI002ED209CD
MNASTVTPMPVGHAQARIDGPLKVSGTARYSADFQFPGMLYAVPVCATVATGSIASIDARRAAALPGVRKIYTRENIGKLYRVPPSSKSKIDERRPPLDDDQIRYYGQYVALVVADTFEQATAAAEAVSVKYTGGRPPLVNTKLSPDAPYKPDTQRGDADAAFAGAAVKLDYTYSTPVETHNPIELHASVALWDGLRFTLYETTQAVMNFREVMAQMLGVPSDHVRVITEYLGSGFGGKLWPWTQAVLAAAAARDLNRPIKLVVSRKMMFHNVGHRPHTQQRMRLAADRDGKLVSLQHDYLYHRARDAEYKENCGEASGFLYSCANVRVAASHSERDVGPATSMRGPGAVPGLFALESAMDELALALNMDPVQLRLRNEPTVDEMENIPFSSRHLKECLTRGADAFGWAQRRPDVGSMRDGDTILGWGMAACTWIAERFAAEAGVVLSADGNVRVASGTQDIGTGTYTVVAQMAAELAGVDVGKVKVVIGDSNLPPGPWSGGSMATGSMVPALVQAMQDIAQQLIRIASDTGGAFAQAGPDTLSFENGFVHRKGQSPETGKRFEDILSQARLARVEGHGKAEGTFGKKNKAYSTHSFGAHFVEVAWQPHIARLRVKRVVTVIDAGRIVNPLTGRNQIEGAVIMGLGMALFEETHYDPRNGMAINSNLADYIMTSHADAPELDVIFLDYPDTKLNAMGVRGIGEIGLAGIAAAITNAVHHATGIRIRDLPVHIEDLLVSSVA